MISSRTESASAAHLDPLVSQVRIRNFKSIGSCDVALKGLSVLVGRNGSGKSNFLDALRFVADALQSSLDHALKSRGGIDDVRRRSTGHPRHFAIDLRLNLGNAAGWYGFEVAARKQGGFVVKRERLTVRDMTNKVIAEYQIEDSKIKKSSVENMPPPAADRLYLVHASGFPEFRGVYDALLSMGFYSLNPQAMRELQSPDAGELLHRDGANIASVVGRIEADELHSKNRIRDFLATIVPGISDFSRVALGPRETLEFRQRVVGSENPWKFYANSMSDGTLRALGVLVAVTQIANRASPVRLVGIEEPETALHAAAAGALVEALREAAVHTQIVLTSHSPDLLDEINIQREQLLAVLSPEGDTKIATIDEASRKALEEQLLNAGDLLRMDQLEPNREDLRRQNQTEMFGDEA